MSVFLCADERNLVQFDLALFVRKGQQGHVRRARSTLILEAQHEVDRIGLLLLFLNFEFLLLSFFFLNVNGRRVWILVASKLKWVSLFLFWWLLDLCLCGVGACLGSRGWSCIVWRSERWWDECLSAQIHFFKGILRCFSLNFLLF